MIDSNSGRHPPRIESIITEDMSSDPLSSTKAMYTCTFPGCESSFSSSVNRRRHERLHSGSKPFKCEYKDCDKSFARKYDMKVHLRVHTKEKPYTCDLDGCGRRFSRNSSLREHERNIHHVSNSSRQRVRPRYWSDMTKPTEREEPEPQLIPIKEEREETEQSPVEKAAIKNLVQKFHIAQQQCNAVSIHDIIISAAGSARPLLESVQAFLSGPVPVPLDGQESFPLEALWNVTMNCDI